MTDDTQDPRHGTQAWSQTVLDTVRMHRSRAAEHHSTVRVCQICGQFGSVQGVIGTRVRSMNAAGFQCGRHGRTREEIDAAVARSPDGFCPICARNIGPGVRGWLCDVCAPVWKDVEVEVRRALHELRGIARDRDILPILLGRVDDARPGGRT